MANPWRIIGIAMVSLGIALIISSFAFVGIWSPYLFWIGLVVAILGVFGMVSRGTGGWG